MLKPSRVPGVFTKAWPQLGPASLTYGMLVKARLPRGVVTPMSLPRVKSCHAQNPDVGRLKPPGCVPVGLTMTYCTEVFDAGVALWKCTAALSASWPSCLLVACTGVSAATSAQTPASGVVAGWCTKVAPAGHLVAFLGTPWQYCVVDVLHVSFAPNRPRMKFCRYGAAPRASLLKVRLAPEWPTVPHWDP